MNERYRILLVEDDENLAYLLRENLEQKGYVVTLCTDGMHAFRLFRQQSFDLCLVDVMLPRKDGYKLAEEIRGLNEKVPLIFLTSRSLETDKIKGFQVGADDYMTKPFSITELCLRMNAILKRSVRQPEIKQKNLCYHLGQYVFDYQNRLLLFPDNSEKNLSLKEAELLKLFCEQKNELIHRQYLMNKVWGNDDYFIAKSMDVFITRLRKLLRDDRRLEIQNIYGTGFKLVVRGTDA